MVLYRQCIPSSQATHPTATLLMLAKQELEALNLCCLSCLTLPSHLSVVGLLSSHLK